MMLKQTNNFTSNAKWSSESVELACYNGATCSAPAPVDTGAVSVTSAGAAIVALAAMLTFWVVKDQKDPNRLIHLW